MATKYPELWAALGAPIPDQLVKTRSQGGRQLSYITARTAMNRLDWVLGPENWWASFTTWGDNGVQCCLTVRLPDGSAVTKCDIGGFAGMADGGDDEKSGVSDALKRACVQFGIGRELYGDGNAVADLGRQVAAAPMGRPAIQDSTGGSLQLSETSPAPSFGKPVDAVIAPQKDFDQWLKRSSEYAAQQQREHQERARVEPTPSQFTPDDLAVYYCWRMQEAGVLDPSAYQMDGKVDHDAAIHVLREAWIAAPDATAQQIRAIVEDRVGRLVNGQREAGQRDRQQSRGNGNGNGNGNGQSGGGNPSPDVPRSGRALFAWVKEQEQRHEVSLLKYLNGFIRLQDFPSRMIDLDADQVAQVHAEAIRKLRAMLPDREEAMAEAMST